MLRLYKCEHFDEEKCGPIKDCWCKYTFDPRHIWSGSDIIRHWVMNKDPIEIETSNCHASSKKCFITFYKEVNE